jgi:hypothetical protein
MTESQKLESRNIIGNIHQYYQRMIADAIEQLSIEILNLLYNPNRSVKLTENHENVAINIKLIPKYEILFPFSTDNFEYCSTRTSQYPRNEIISDYRLLINDRIVSSGFKIRASLYNDSKTSFTIYLERIV